MVGRLLTWSLVSLKSMLWHSALTTLLTSLGLKGSKWSVGHNLNRKGLLLEMAMLEKHI